MSSPRGTRIKDMAARALCMQADLPKEPFEISLPMGKEEYHKKHELPKAKEQFLADMPPYVRLVHWRTPLISYGNGYVNPDGTPYDPSKHWLDVEFERSPEAKKTIFKDLKSHRRLHSFDDEFKPEEFIRTEPVEKDRRYQAMHKERELAQGLNKKSGVPTPVTGKPTSPPAKSRRRTSEQTTGTQSTSNTPKAHYAMNSMSTQAPARPVFDLRFNPPPMRNVKPVPKSTKILGEDVDITMSTPAQLPSASRGGRASSVSATTTTTAKPPPPPPKDAKAQFIASVHAYHYNKKSSMYGKPDGRAPMRAPMNKVYVPVPVPVPTGSTGAGQAKGNGEVVLPIPEYVPTSGARARSDSLNSSVISPRHGARRAGEERPRIVETKLKAMKDAKRY